MKYNKKIGILILILIILLTAFGYLINNPPKNVEYGVEQIKLSPIQSEGISSEFDKRNNVLVLYNENYLYGREIAEYYANARNISSSRICGVREPVGTYVSAEQFKGVRKTIVEDCICRIITEEKGLQNTPNPCTISNIAQIVNSSPITHIVLTKGMPIRLFNTGWTGEDVYTMSPSADYYLSIYIYANTDIFSSRSYNYPDTYSIYASQYGNQGYISQPSSSIISYVRALNNSIDRRTVFGRIESIDLESTKRLIDRTLTAENFGVKGNFLTNVNPAGQNPANPDINDIGYRFLSELTSNNVTICDKYIIDKTGLWNYTDCRTGASLNGNVPGEVYQPSISIPKAYNVGLYLGDDYGPNMHAGFDGFSALLNWRINDSNCLQYCGDFTDPNQKSLCKSNSKDYIKDLNSDCVGANPTLIGWQYRSFPVEFYGYWPNGYEGGLTVPKVTTGDSYKDNYLTDDKFLRFGEQDLASNDYCILENSSTAECKEKIFFTLNRYKPIYYKNNATLGINKTISFMYRTSPENVNNKILFSYIYSIVNESGAKIDKSYYETINILPGSDNWTKYEKNVSQLRNEIGISGNNLYYNGLIIGVNSGSDFNFSGYFDVDGIMIYDRINSANAFTIEDSSFNDTKLRTTIYGDYAFNAIDRLGGIGWWGSMSHFGTGGHAYSDDEALVGALFSGRTIGESLAYTSTERSGLAYIDPLYNPVGIKIYLYPRVINNQIPRLNPESDLLPQYPSSYQFGEILNNFESQIQINAFHGKGNGLNTNWSLKVCYNNKYNCINNASTWIEVNSGVGGAYGLILPTHLSDLVRNFSKDELITLKLRVWNNGEEKNDLVNYASLYYNSTKFGNKIIGNINLWNNFSNNITLQIDGKNILDNGRVYNSTKSISFSFKNYAVINFTHDFSKNDLNLSNLNIITGENPSFIIIQNLTNNYSKILTLRRSNSSVNSICFSDSEINNFTKLKENCTMMNCPGSKNNITCTRRSSYFEVTGLIHSGLIENYNSSLGNTNSGTSNTNNPSQTSTGSENNQNTTPNEFTENQSNIVADPFVPSFGFNPETENIQNNISNSSDTNNSSLKEKNSLYYLFLIGIMLLITIFGGILFYVIYHKPKETQSQNLNSVINQGF